MIQIDEMTLRIPGIGEEEGRQLGADVAQRLAGQLPDNLAPQQLGELRVQLPLSPGLSRGQMAEAVANRILLELKFK